VLLDELSSGGQLLRVWGLPAGGFQQPLSSNINVVFPGGEQPGVTPLGDGVPDRGSCFQHHGGEAASQQTGGCSQPDRAGTENDPRQPGGLRGGPGGGGGGWHRAS